MMRHDARDGLPPHGNISRHI
jgi:hypothetical protein